MRGMGDTTAYLRRGIREIICLALFFFTFLACEYLFDVRIAEFVPSSEVVIYESIVVGASVIGFFVRPFLYYRLPQTIDATSDITGVLLVSALLLMITAVRFEVVIAGGLVACCALGYCGSTAHANFARRFARTPCLARAAALSYAMGVLVQVLNHMVMPAGIPQQAVLVVCATAQVASLHGARRAKLRDESDPSFEPSVAGLSVDALEHGAKWQDDPEAKAAFRRAVVRLTVATAYLSGVFAALNAGFTTLHAVGAVDLGDWPRLLLVVSSLAAGALFDLHGRSYMNIGMTCAAILSTLSFFCAHRRRQWRQRARCHDHLLSGLGLFRGVLYHKICRRLALCALVIFLAVHGSRRQQRVLDARDGAGGGDHLESKRAGCGRCGARDICGHCDYAAGAVGATSR